MSFGRPDVKMIEPLERRTLLAGTIAGTVFNDADGNGRRDAGEGGVANQRVFVDLNFDGVFQNNEPSRLTDSLGNYAFANRPNGIQRVRTVVPTGRRLTAPGLVFHDVSVVGRTVSNINFGTTTTAIVRGSVFSDNNGNGRRDAGERGLSGWRVFLDRNNNGQFDANERSRFTDAAGNYRFAGLTPGRYSIRIVQQGGFTPTAPVSGVFRVTLTAAQSLSNRHFGQDPI